MQKIEQKRTTMNFRYNCKNAFINDSTYEYNITSLVGAFRAINEALALSQHFIGKGGKRAPLLLSIPLALYFRAYNF